MTTTLMIGTRVRIVAPGKCYGFEGEVVKVNPKTATVFLDSDQAMYDRALELIEAGLSASRGKVDYASLRVSPRALEVVA